MGWRWQVEVVFPREVDAEVEERFDGAADVGYEDCAGGWSGDDGGEAE